MDDGMEVSAASVLARPAADKGNLPLQFASATAPAEPSSTEAAITSCSYPTASAWGPVLQSGGKRRFYGGVTVTEAATGTDPPKQCTYYVGSCVLLRPEGGESVGVSALGTHSAAGEAKWFKAVGGDVAVIDCIFQDLGKGPIKFKALWLYRRHDVIQQIQTMFENVSGALAHIKQSY